MFGLLVTFLLYVLVPIILALVIVLIFIGLGSLLAGFFPLSLFEATLILILVAIPIFWAYWRVFLAAKDVMEDDTAPAEDEELEDFPVFVPLRPVQKRRKPKRK